MPSNRPEEERAFRKPVGRTPKLSEAVTLTVCQYLRDGAYLETAAAAAGIGKTTLFTWLRKASDDDAAGLEDTPHQEFRVSVEEAIAEAELDDLREISKAAKKGSWQACAWRLERRHPKRWGTAKRVVVDDEGDGTANVFKLNYSLEGED